MPRNILPGDILPRDILPGDILLENNSGITVIWKFKDALIHKLVQEIWAA